MHKSFFLATVIFTALASGSALAQSIPNLDGLWRAEDGSTTVRVAKCPTSPNWCAIVVAEQLKPGEPSQLNHMLVRDMRTKGNRQWAGQYAVDGQNMKAGAKLLRPDMLAFKVCAFAFLCDTIRLNRIRG
jgi:uncharacterized protein (DUF2147 family)